MHENNHEWFNAVMLKVNHKIVSVIVAHGVVDSNAKEFNTRKYQCDHVVVKVKGAKKGREEQLKN